ncbi:MAG: CPBP family intramembrane glutamic endopeptidase [Candidatus Thorarchaeota archaeon]
MNVSEHSDGNECLTSSKTNPLHKLAAVSEVLLVRFVIYSLVALALMQVMYGTPAPDQYPLESYYVVGSLWFVIPAVMILGLRREPHLYGLTSVSSRQSVDLALSAFPFMVLGMNAVMVLLMMLGWSYLEPLGALTLTASLTVASLFIIRMSYRKYPSFHNVSVPYRTHCINVVAILLLLLLPMVLGLVLGRLSLLLVSTVVWQFVFSGFGEEVFFRGYIQSRLNMAFGRPFEWLGIRFGVGLFISASIFSVTHMLNTANIWLGDFNIAWWWGTFSLVGGILLGLLREKTGSVVASGTLHGLEAVGEGLALLF